MPTIWSRTALTPQGWLSDVAVEVGEDGRIAAVRPGQPASGTRVDILCPRRPTPTAMPSSGPWPA